MRKSIIIVLVPIFVFLIFPANLPAKQRGIMVTAKTPSGKEIPLYKGSYAFVVGNGTYTNGWDPLPGAIRDVKDVARALKANGFNVVLKTDLTRDEFNRAFGNFCYKYGTDVNNRILFYYAGHGHTQKMFTGEDLGSLVMVDAPVPEKDPIGFRLSIVNMQTIVTEAKIIKARHVLFMFDSCFSGSVLNLREMVVPEIISDSVSLPVRQFITAGRANEPVPDHSIFKQAFLDLLEGRDKEPIPDGYITGEELGLYLKNKVPVYNPAQHPQYGKIKDIRLDKGDFVFILKISFASQPLDMGQSNSIRDYFKIIEKKEANKKKWALWQKRMETELSKVERYDKNSAFSAEEKAKAWKGLLASYSADNPYTVKDNDFRKKAAERSRYWNELFDAEEQESLEIRLEELRDSIQSTSTYTPPPSTSNVIEWDGVYEAGQKMINNLGMEFVYIMPGSFMMGSPSGESGRDEDERQHRVTLTNGFYMQSTEVTQGQWERVMGRNPSSFTECGADCPVEEVSWHDVQEFIEKLSEMEENNKYRLPTEAEWEYAARAGSITRFFFGNAYGRLGQYAWYSSNSGEKTHSVAQKKPNAWGLYDIHGNVRELCHDRYGDYPSGSVIDPTGSLSSSYSAHRGGSWYRGARHCRSADRNMWYSRDNTSSHVGFRLVAVIDPESTSDIINRDGTYVAYSTGIVKDTETGLEWKVGPDTETDDDDARSWVHSLNFDGGGWRIPTIAELKTLFKKESGSHNITHLLKTAGWSVVCSDTSEASLSAYGHCCFAIIEWPSSPIRADCFEQRAFAVRSRNDG